MKSQTGSATYHCKMTKKLLISVDASGFSHLYNTCFPIKIKSNNAGGCELSKGMQMKVIIAFNITSAKQCSGKLRQAHHEFKASLYIVRPYVKRTITIKRWWDWETDNHLKSLFQVKADLRNFSSTKWVSRLQTNAQVLSSEMGGCLTSYIINRTESTVL